MLDDHPMHHNTIPLRGSNEAVPSSPAAYRRNSRWGSAARGGGSVLGRAAFSHPGGVQALVVLQRLGLLVEGEEFTG